MFQPLNLKASLTRVLVIENIAMLVVIIKIAISPLDYASALMLLPVAALYIAKVIMYDAKLSLSAKQEELEQELSAYKLAFQAMELAQKEVFKQAEETKALLSKLNITSAFAPRNRA